MIDEWCRALPGVVERVADLRRAGQALLERDRLELRARAAFGGITGAALHSDAVELLGPPSRRLRVKRLLVGDAVHQPFRPSVGVTECASEAADVRGLWDRLLELEAHADGILHGSPAAVLDVPHACASIHGRMLRIDLHDSGDIRLRDEVIAVPRLTHAMPPRKLRNFGHWLVDCLPQVVALVSIDERAKVLLPAGLNAFQRATLMRVGLSASQVVEWGGAPIRASRVLVFETDGRASGGRPLSGLQLLRSRIGPDSVSPDSSRPRRVYVSRRDARAKRQWVRNEADVEQLFRRHGFEIVSMKDCPMDEQVQIFRNAHVVAGVSGAGLTGLIFSPPETQAIVLASDTLMRWYADQRSARSLWLQGTPRQLAALGDSPRFYAHLAAACGQVCHSFVGDDQLPIGRLSSFLDAVLTRETDW